MSKNIINITGQRFGRLTAVEPVGKSKNKSILWKCKCDCGKTFVVSGTSMRKGNTKSCGCLQSELRRARKGKLHQCWRGGITHRKDGYISIYSINHPNKDHHNHVFEHRLVMEKHFGRYLTKEEIVHHENDVRGDNRIENLKVFANAADHANYHHKRNKTDYAIAKPFIAELKSCFTGGM